MPVQINEVIIRTTVSQEEDRNIPPEHREPAISVSVPDKEIILELIESFLQEKNER